MEGLEGRSGALGGEEGAEEEREALRSRGGLKLEAKPFMRLG
jgi:hypothetical protein